MSNLQLAKAIMGEELQTPSVYINGVAVNPLTEERLNQVAQALLKKPL
jgi:hypothetical protein